MYSITLQVSPGYLAPLQPACAPQKAEHWTAVMADIEKVVMPGVTHWHHPQFHAYFPTANSYPAIVADMLSGAISCIGFSWLASPACTELEMLTMDWLGKMLALPEHFLFASGGPGGGVIQGTASEATLVAVLSARTQAIAKHAKEQDQEVQDSNITSRLVAYCNSQAHSSVERAGMLAGVRMRLLESDENFSLRGETVAKAVREDREQGLVPFCVIATLGTTSSCAFDKLQEIGPVCAELGLWLHVDAAYAGSAFVCPEFRPLLDGIELADSFNFNPHKWMLVNFDCSAMWFRDARLTVDAFSVDPVYLKHSHQGEIPDYRHWQIPLGRRFRSLKLWFVMRLYGVEGIQAHIRTQVELAKQFAAMVEKDARFELPVPAAMGLVCFRLKGSNTVNEKLNTRINEAAVIHVTPSKIRETYILRFAVCSRFTVESDIQLAWDEVRRQVDTMTTTQSTTV